MRRAEGMTILEAIRAFFTGREEVHVRDLYSHLPHDKEHSIRARVYENLGRHFKRVGRGLYAAAHDGAVCVVVQGDAWEELKKLPTESFDALVTDPPYPWLNYALRQGTTRKPRGKWSFETREMDRELGLELHRVLKEGAHTLVFAPAETEKTRDPIAGMVRLMEECGFRFRKKLIWDKVRIGLGYTGRARHELVVLFSRGRKTRKQCDLTIPDVLSVPLIDPRNRTHETEKPAALLELLVRLATDAGEAVLDCFAGSCSTGRAALALGRDSLMIETDVAMMGAVTA